SSPSSTPPWHAGPRADASSKRRGSGDLSGRGCSSGSGVGRRWSSCGLVCTHRPTARSANCGRGAALPLALLGRSLPALLLDLLVPAFLQALVPTFAASPQLALSLRGHGGGSSTPVS